MKPIPKMLSKTKIMKGYQCLKNLYLTIHHPELEEPITPEQQARFDSGHEVGAEARKRFPGGVLIDNAPWDFVGSLKRTRELLRAESETRILYEAAFEHKGLYCRADIMTYSKESGRWTIYEVKSSTKVKPEQIEDIRLQTWIMVQCGLAIEKVCILHLNKDCVFPDLSNLFKEEDVTELVRERYSEVLPKLKVILEAIKGTQVPDLDIGEHCELPFDCGFKTHCWKEKKIPDISVFDMPGMREQKWKLYEMGVITLDDPRILGMELNATQLRMIDAFKTHKRFIDAGGIREMISTWQYPYVYLDFETINPAIPRYPGTRPYQQTPFQFSVHIERDGASRDELEHHEYLHEDHTDPREGLIEALLKACGTEGSIIAYYGQFEAWRIEELAEHSPKYRDQLNALIERIEDPLPIIRSHVYDHEFRGSFSLKSVGPALLGEKFSYEGLLVGDGGSCQRAWEEMLKAQTSQARKSQLKQAILEYCKKDTFVMVELVNWLRNCS